MADSNTLNTRNPQPGSGTGPMQAHAAPCNPGRAAESLVKLSVNDLSHVDHGFAGTALRKLVKRAFQINHNAAEKVIQDLAIRVEQKFPSDYKNVLFHLVNSGMIVLNETQKEAICRREVSVKDLPNVEDFADALMKGKLA